MFLKYISNGAATVMQKISPPVATVINTSGLTIGRPKPAHKLIVNFA
jgi:hypothetical protein